MLTFIIGTESSEWCSLEDKVHGIWGMGAFLDSNFLDILSKIGEL